MKLLEACELINRQDAARVRTRRCFLACGFTPLHFQTFLHAHLQTRFPEDKIELLVGQYGDLGGNLELATGREVDFAVAIVEMPDLDPRLGIRQLGGWQPEKFPDILACVHQALERIQSALTALAAVCPVTLALPTLPLLPIDLPAGAQAGAFELDLQREIACFAACASRNQSMRVVNPQTLDVLSPVSRRFDLKSELLTGFPYRLEHSEKLAGLIAPLLQNAPPKKGLITDLDDTCWKGILGEVGVDGISWDLDGQSQVHAIYQQFLNALAHRGVLLAAASKNDPALVKEAFRRADLHLDAETLFPIEAHWHPKSESVSRILKAWNVAEDAVVFVDDSASELAEVQAAHPEITCLLFPKNDPDGVLALLGLLRDLFGKAAVREEDRLRIRSVRNAPRIADARSEGSPSYENFLRSAQATIVFHFANEGQNARAFELFNKTNQFNLNGRRFSESQWQAYFRQENAFLLTASYEDKFGPLGEIAAMLGRGPAEGQLHIDGWVMSCRAFSRRIENQCLAYLFNKFEVDAIVFAGAETPRNAPLREFLRGSGLAQGDFLLSRKQFHAACPPLFHQVKERPHG